MTLREARAAVRRWPGTDLAERYSKAIAHLGEGRSEPPDAHERSLADFLDPTRPGSTTELVNAVSREMGMDVAAWRYDRLLSMVRQIESESAEQRAERELGDLG